MNISEMLAHQGLVAWVVLGVLAVMSLLVWAAIVSKALSFRRCEKGYDRLRRAIFERRQFQEIRAWCWDQEGNPYARVVLDAAGELEETGGRPAENDRLWQLQKEMLERSLLQGLRREATRGSRWMPLLATAGNVSPFIGLFGTVWGIMKSFREIGLEKSASLAVVAPGISEALLATAAGLFAAIPAVIAFNHFRARLAAQNARMSDVIAEVVNLLERERLEEGGALGQGRPTLLGSDPRQEQGEA